MRKFRFICLLVIAVAVSCFAQETNSIQVRIIDRVRLRESIGVDAKILATLESGDEGTYIDKQETEIDPAHSEQYRYDCRGLFLYHDSEKLNNKESKADDYGDTERVEEARSDTRQYLDRFLDGIGRGE